MNIKPTKLDNVFSFTHASFFDFRGEYVEIFNNKELDDYGIKLDFVQDDISISDKNVLRGIHGDTETWKFISCLYGSVYAVVVNCLEGNEDFGKWESFILNEKKRNSILVPPGYGNSYLSLTDKSIYHYKQTGYYDREKQFSYKWDDDRFNIFWPIKSPILSKRDGG